MEQRIKDKFQLLPLYKRKEISQTLKVSEADWPRLWQIICPKLPEITFLHTITDFTDWLNDESNWVFLPFVWDAIEGVRKDSWSAYTHLKYGLATQIIAKLKALELAGRNGLSQNLLYADFNGVDLTNVSFWAGDLTGAKLSALSMKGAKLNLAIAVGANFRGAGDLEIQQLINLGNLYRTKFSIDGKIKDKKVSANEVEMLEEKIISNYTEALRTKYVPADFGNETQKQLHTQNVIEPLLKLIAWSDPELRPLKWGMNDNRFHNRFDFLYQNHAQVLATLKEEIEAIVPQDNMFSGSYYRDRLNRDDWKPVFAQTPWKGRTAQIQRLQSINGSQSSLVHAVDTLAQVKKEIEREWNIWDSELLRKINETVDGIVSSNNLSSTQEQVQQNKH